LATGKLGNGKIWQRKIRGHEKNGNKKLMSEITATDKRQRKKRQPEKWATENWATGKLGNKNGPVGKEGNTCNCPKETATGKLRAWRKVTAVYRRAYDSRHLQADCQKPGSASEPYARQSSMGYLYLFSDYAHLPITSQTCSPAKGRFVMVTPSSLMVVTRRMFGICGGKRAFACSL